MYHIKVNGDQEFTISRDSLDDFDAVETHENQFHILHNKASVKAKILNKDFNRKTYSIKVNNNTYEVKIKDELDQLVRDMGFALGGQKQVNDIKAPMPGLILEINVKAGQEVEEDDSLLILEAMKMENVITSPRQGVIKSVKVKQADTVDKNALLIEFE
jgi:biotin carboxyl carrier protein